VGRLGLVQSSDDQEAEQAWEQLPAAAHRCLELAHLSLTTAGLAVGSALADANGRVVAAGRNRAYDPPGGSDPLQGTPLAHAEMNVLASVPTGRDMSTDTLWSTQRPCSMCDAALVFTGAGTVRWLAPDPWAIASGVNESHDGDELRRLPPHDDRWIVVANLLFLASVALTRGFTNPTVERNRELEPETHLLLQKLLHGGAARMVEQPVTVLLADVWGEIREAAVTRHDRVVAEDDRRRLRATGHGVG